MYDQALQTTAAAPPTLADRDPSVIDLISAELERLDSAIGQLDERLMPVLKPGYDGPEKPGGVPTPVQSLVRSQGDELGRQIGRLLAILDRLEV